MRKYNQRVKNSCSCSDKVCTVQDLDCSIISMLTGHSTQEGDVKDSNFSGDEIVRNFSDPLESETIFQQAFSNERFDYLKSVVSDSGNSAPPPNGLLDSDVSDNANLDVSTEQK